MKKLIPIEEKNRQALEDKKHPTNGVECPKCEGEMFGTSEFIYLSLPAKIVIFCACGYETWRCA